MMLIIFQRKILERKFKNVFYCRVQFHSGQSKRCSAQLQVYLLHMIAVNMHVAKRMNEFARLQIAHLGNHQSKQGIRSDIERHT